MSDPENTNQSASPAEDVNQFLDELESSMAGDDVPPEVEALDKGDKSKQGQAAHAYKVLKDKGRKAAELLRQKDLEIEELKKSKQQVQTPPLTPAQGVDVARTIVERLRAQALMNLNLASREQAPELVDMEVNRLYNQLQAEQARRSEAQGKADSVIEQVIGSATQLDERDKATVRERVKKLDVLHQADVNIVRSVVAQVIGERVLSGDAQPEAPQPDVPASRGPDRAAASDLKARGRGVPPPTRSAGTPKPATAEELAEMRKLGLSDLEAYRRAKTEKAKYLSQ